MGNASTLAGFLLLLGAVSATPGHAQPASVDGAYTKLSPGNAKIARALFEAQVTNTTPTSRRPSTTGDTAAAAAPKSLTLDQIAAMKQSGQSWGRVFETLKAQGLVQDKSLGQVVSRYQHQQASGSVVTTAATRADRSAAPASGESSDSGSLDNRNRDSHITK
jgi:hypothetical protein